jgi:4'-phosphopantetheinyl transferase
MMVETKTDDYQVKFCWVDIPAFSRAYLPSPFHPNGHWLKRAVPFARRELPEDVFSSAELETVNGFYTVKRQVEWLAGRYAAKSVVAAAVASRETSLSISDLSVIEIRPQPDGSPRVAGLDEFAISLSHAQRYAVCAITNDGAKGLGVDVEKVRPAPSSEFMDVGFTAREIEALADQPAEGVYRSWTIKEAYLKYVRRGFNENLHNVEIFGNRIIDGGVSQEHLTIVSEPVFDDYYLSTVLGESSRTT